MMERRERARYVVVTESKEVDPTATVQYVKRRAYPRRTYLRAREDESSDESDSDDSSDDDSDNDSEDESDDEEEEEEENKDGIITDSVRFGYHGKRDPKLTSTASATFNDQCTSISVCCQRPFGNRSRRCFRSWTQSPYRTRRYLANHGALAHRSRIYR